MKIELLKSLGLNEKAAKIYLAALSSGLSTVKEIATKAGLKRPTVYLYIEELIKDGLIERVLIGSKERYQAVEPTSLEKRLEHNLRQIREVLPELELLRSAGQSRPSIKILEGERGLNELYEEMRTADSLLFWSDLSAWEKKFPNAFTKLSNAIQSKKIQTREILPDTKEAKLSSKRYAITAGNYYSSRIASGPIHNDNAIYNNVVALFRIHEYNLFVVRIEDASIAATMRTLFNMAWKSAKPFIN